MLLYHSLSRRRTPFSNIFYVKEKFVPKYPAYALEPPIRFALAICEAGSIGMLIRSVLATIMLCDFVKTLQEENQAVGLHFIRDWIATQILEWK